MLNRFYIIGCLILLVQLLHGQHLQLVENRGEFGLFAGKSSYVGDIAPGGVNFKNSMGAFFKKQFNDYGGFRLNYEQLSLAADDNLSNNIYAKSRNYYFSRGFHDISLTGEFNFIRYLPGNKSYRFTPYLGIGIGYMLALGKDSVSFTPPSLVAEKKGFVHFPVQVGFKFNLTQRWNLFAETMYRLTTSDELDYLVDGQLVNAYQGSRSGKDQFFSVKAGISYGLIKIYGEEKWKPGKKSRLASQKEKESGDKKSGFFSRLKFKRK
jgi:opacity protein-like surface antigen